MIFKQWQDIIEGKKTVTRRLVDLGDQPYWGEAGEIVMIVRESQGYPKGRKLYEVGRSYAVQPGRGQPTILVNYNHPCYGVDIWAGADPISDYGIAIAQGYQEARVEIVSLGLKRLQDITPEDAIKEGVKRNWLGDDCPPEYADEWRNYLGGEDDSPCLSSVDSYRSLWDSIYQKQAGKCWDDNPSVWRIEFKLVRECQL